MRRTVDDVGRDQGLVDDRAVPRRGRAPVRNHPPGPQFKVHRVTKEKCDGMGKGQQAGEGLAS